MNFDSFFGHMLTHWAASGVNGYGKPSFSSPTRLKGRWQDERAISRSAAGVKEIIFGSVVYVPSVVSVGDYLAEGSYTGADPLLISTAKEIKTVSKTRDFSGMETLYTVFLKER